MNKLLESFVEDTTHFLKIVYSIVVTPYAVRNIQGNFATRLQIFHIYFCFQLNNNTE